MFKNSLEKEKSRWADDKAQLLNSKTIKQPKFSEILRVESFRNGALIEGLVKA
jgi:hypothetical protein